MYDYGRTKKQMDRQKDNAKTYTSTKIPSPVVEDNMRYDLLECINRNSPPILMIPWM